MWHLEIREGQLEDVRRAAQEEAAAVRRHLQVQAAEQLRKEKETLRTVERSRLLRVRWAGPAGRWPLPLLCPPHCAAPPSPVVCHPSRACSPPRHRPA